MTSTTTSTSTSTSTSTCTSTSDCSCSSSSCLICWLSKQFNFHPQLQGLRFHKGEEGNRWIQSTKTIEIPYQNQGTERTKSNTKNISTTTNTGTNDDVYSSIAYSLNSPLLTFPESLLFTPKKIVQSSMFSFYFRTSSSNLNGTGATPSLSLSSSCLLCLFLLHHRRLSSRSSISHSPFSPYLHSLPQFYTTPEWWTMKQIQLIQCSKSKEEIIKERKKKIQEIKQEWKRMNEEIVKRKNGESEQLKWENEWMKMQKDEDESQSLVEKDGEDALPLTMDNYSLPDHSSCCSYSASSCTLFTLSEYQWAASTVATRSVYLPPSSTSSSSSSISINGVTLTDGGTSILIPFFDMLNHSSYVTSTPHYDGEKKQYQVFIQQKDSSVSSSFPSTTSSSTSSSSLKKSYILPPNSDICISYGSHNNLILLNRYGFCLEDNYDDQILINLILIEAEVVVVVVVVVEVKSTQKLTQISTRKKISANND